MAVSSSPTRNATWRAGRSIALAGLIACGASPTAAREAAGVLELQGGGGQQGIAGYLLDQPVTVRFVADDGDPMAFAAVRAAATGALGAASPLTGVTDAEGVVEFDWRLALAIGAQELLVSAPGSPATPVLRVAATSQSNAMRAIGGGVDVMCGIDGAGQLGCWSPSLDPDHSPRFVPHVTTERFLTLALSPGISRPIDGCAAAVSGRIWCFGVSPDAHVEELSEVAGSYPAFTTLAVGGEAAATWCGLAADGTAWCWGSNSQGVLGDGSAVDRAAPTPVATPVRFTRVVIGPDHACAISTAEATWCWGSNAAAQLGQPATTAPFLTPVRVPTDLQFTHVATPNAESSCGVERVSGHPWCWGRKTRLGVPDATVTAIEGDYSLFPLYVEPLVGVVGIGRVDAATVVLRHGTLGAWWGDLSPTRDVTIAAVPQPFVTTVGLGSLAIPHSRGAVCGVPEGATAQLCVRFGTITGYETFAFAGFGMPLP
jgi:hypothetical protein